LNVGEVDFALTVIEADGQKESQQQQTARQNAQSLKRDVFLHLKTCLKGSQNIDSLFYRIDQASEKVSILRKVEIPSQVTPLAIRCK
jgi:hypothetical protein